MNEGLDDGKSMSLWQLLIGIVDRPAMTMKYVGGKTGWLWLAPALLILVGLVIQSVTTAPQMSAFASQEMQRRMLDMPPEQAEAMADQLSTFSSPLFVALSAIIGGLILLLVLWLLGAGVLYTACLFSGGESSFKQMFTLMTWAWVPFFLRDLTQTAYTAYSGQIVNHQGLSGLVATGDRMKDAANLLYLLLSQLDPFFLWHLVLVAVGVAVINRFARTKATVIGLIYGVAITGMTLIPTLLGRIFS